jgi:DNA-binding response OmpR family regulator
MLGIVSLPRPKEAPRSMSNPMAAKDIARKRRALVVEDDALVRMAIMDMLEVAGHGAAEAADGETALSHLETADGFDVLISDISLPGISGEQLAVEVRRRWPEMRIVLVSGRDRVAVAEAGEVLFLPKPFQFEDLLRVVEG